MNKRLLYIVLSLVAIVLLCASLLACGDDTTISTPSSNPQSTPDSSPSSTPESTPSSTPESKPDDTVEPDPWEGISPEDIKLLNIDYKTMTYVGTSLKDFSPLFDEQTVLNDPYRDKDDIEYAISIVQKFDADGNGDITPADDEHIYEITIDLGAEHYIECFYVFFNKAGDSVTFEIGTPFAYEHTVSYTCKAMSWSQVDIKLRTRYINVKFNNGQAPAEILGYGALTGEYDAPSTEKHEYKTFDYLLGINGNQADRVSTLRCANYFRDYINWMWCWTRDVYPTLPGTNYNGIMSSDYDVTYMTMADIQMSPVPCFMFKADDFRVNSIDDYMKPETYVEYGELLTQTAVRFGYNPSNTKEVVKVYSGSKARNRDVIHWIEAGNEPNGEGNDGFSPYELAALTSLCYDGHEGKVTSPSGSIMGVKVADPNMKLAMAGLAGVGTRYIQAMSFWMQHNRDDGKVALDAFNVHTYCKKLISYNGYQVYVGVCPEIGKITEYLEELCAWRDKFHPDKEVWLTEFGWDTNTSYETENACHPYGDYTARELQAMWLVRAYFMFSSIGVDRAAMYMASDLGDEATSTGKYGTSGVISKSGELKDSYYYIYTLKNTMGDMYFAEIIDSGNENVWIYRFENGKGKSCYAVWCPTMDNIKVEGYSLNIDGTSATMTCFANLETSGVSQELTVDNGCVTVNVSEKPVLIFSE